MKRVSLTRSRSLAPRLNQGKSPESQDNDTTERLGTTEREQGSSPEEVPSHSPEPEREEISETIPPNMDPLTLYNWGTQKWDRNED